MHFQIQKVAIAVVVVVVIVAERGGGEGRVVAAVAGMSNTHKIMQVPIHWELGFMFVGPAKDCFIIVLKVTTQLHVH